MIASLSGQTLVGRSRARRKARAQVARCVPRLPPHMGSFLLEWDPGWLPLYKTAAGPPLSEPGTPDPSLALITADQFDNRIDCEKDFFSCSSPVALYSQWKRKYSAISYPRSERALAKKKQSKAKQRKGKEGRKPRAIDSHS